ncbi:MAG: hypothetical protein ACO22S_05370 [Burkholderiaceae bacterium]
MQIGQDLNEALDGLLAGIDSLLADRDSRTVAGIGQDPDGQSNGASASAALTRGSVPETETAILSALALACQSQSMGRDAQQTYRALLRRAVQSRALGGAEAQAKGLQSLVRLDEPMALSPRWVHWFIRLGKTGTLSSVSADVMRFIPDEPLDANDWAALGATGPLSVLVRAPQASSEADVDQVGIHELSLPICPEIQPVPAGCHLDDVMPMAALDQQSPCLIYWLDHWLPSHPSLLGLALPLRAIPALTDLSWAALVRSTES